MSKTAEFVKLLSVIILSIVLLGMVGYFIPQIAKLSVAPLTPVPALQTSAFNGTSPEGQRLAATIGSALEKITGPGKINVTVALETQKIQEILTQDTLLPDSAVVKETSTNTTLTDTQDIQKITYDFSTETRTVQNNAEQIKRQSITVLIDGTDMGKKSIYEPRTRTEMATYTGLVKAIAGFDEARGDTLEIINMPFMASSSNTIFGFDRVLFVQSVLLALFFALCILIIIRFILPMIYLLMQPATAIYTPLPLQNTPSEQIVGTIPLSKSQLIRQMFIQTPDNAVLLLNRWIFQQNVQTGELSGLQKAAILLLALGEETIKSVFLKLPESAMCDISRTMASLGTIQSQTVQSVFDAFLKMSTGEADLTPTQNYVNHMLANALPTEKADALLKEINLPVGGKNVWEKLEKVDAKILADTLQSEYPQTIAVILYHLSNEQAGAVLNHFSESLTMDVLMRLTALQSVEETTLKQVEKGLEQHLQSLFGNTPKSGKEKASDILSLMDKKTDILNTLFERSPDMARQISAGILSFEDIAKWPDSAIRTLLEHADRPVVVVALKGSSDVIKNAFARNMSPAVWGSVLKETNKMGAVKVKDIDAALHTLVKLAQELTRQKKLTLTVSS